MALQRSTIKLAIGTTVQSHTARLEAELAAVRQIGAAMATIRKVKRDFPSLFEGFKAELQAAIDQEPPAEEPEPTAPPASELDVEAQEEYGVEKLIAWFRARGNEPATIQQMAK